MGPTHFKHLAAVISASLIWAKTAEVFGATRMIIPLLSLVNDTTVGSEDEDSLVRRLLIDLVL